MTSKLLIAGAAALALAGVRVVVVLGHHPAADDDADHAATASVTLDRLQSQTLTDTVQAFGVVQGDPARVETIAAPRALIVTRVLVEPGAQVAAGAPLLRVQDTPAAALALRQARDAADFAQRDLARVRRLYAAHLAADDQLSAAEKTASDAASALHAQSAMDAGGGVIRADKAGVVAAIAVSSGDHAAQDAALLTLSPAGGVTARLFLDPSLAAVKVGAPVSLRVNGSETAISAHLSAVGAVVDPASHMLVAIAPLPGAAAPLGAPVTAEVVTGSHVGLTAPRASVVYDETGAHLFIVAQGKAQRAFVTPGHAYGERIEVKGPVSAGQAVAVGGAYELDDGMAVRTGQ